MPVLFYYEPLTDSLPIYVVLLIFAVPFLGGLGFYFYKTRHARSWRRGVFPQSLKPTDDNFLEAYLALAAKLIVIDYHSSKNKIQFMNEYFNRYFKFASYNFSDSLVFSLKHPIQTDTVTDWMKIHLQAEGARSQVIYFLVGLISVNGKMEQKELRFLQQINHDLELSPKNFTQIIAIYEAYFRSKDGVSEGKVSPVNTDYYYEILGVEKGATDEQLKKAYRMLVKKHHPDNFTTSSESQQKIATNKFIEIQNAYEYLIAK